MQHPALPLIDDALFIDNSSLERFTTCPRSAEYYICNKRESSEDRVALGFGKRIHTILETRYKFHPNVVPPRLSADVGGAEVGTGARMFAAAQAAFADFLPPTEEEYRNFSTATDLITAYNNHYPIEAFEVLQLPSGLPAIEVPFAVPLGEITVNSPMWVRSPKGEVAEKQVGTIKIIWTGKIDLIYRREGRIYIMDHKTTSMMGPNYFKEFDLSSQVYGYLWAAAKLLNQPIAGFIVNALAVRKQTKTGKRFEFERYPIPGDDFLVAEWIEDTLHIISDFIEMAKRAYFPKHTKWCVGKYGLCPYIQVCQLPEHSKETILMSGNFKTVEWDPLNPNAP
jgi:hypothetical protein